MNLGSLAPELMLLNITYSVPCHTEKAFPGMCVNQFEKHGLKIIFICTL